jgi:cytidylate kinase
MQIICVSRGSQSRGKEFAEKLAAKLGYECTSREQLLEEATRRKIPIGKLETAIIRPHIFSEQLAIEMEHYKALATSILCEKALEKSIVYHGRTGHLLFPGVENILKIRVVADMEYRIQHVMRTFGISRAKAKKYVDQVEDDRRRWVKQFYGVDWDVFALYDLVLNLSHVSVDNAASAVCTMAQLPEFQATPATVNTVKNLYLASKSRLMLAMDSRTSGMNARVRISNGNIYVIYPYQQAKQAAFIPRVLESLEGIDEIICTEAQTNILWIQEAFDEEDPSYRKVKSLAEMWDAAVELIKLIPSEESEQAPAAEAVSTESSETWRETGIIDEGEDISEEDAEDVSKVYERLINDGRAGGKRIVRGNQKALLQAIDRSIGYRIVVLDKTFLSKGHATQTRLLREWSNTLSESLRAPVVTMNEIASRYHFGARQAVRMVVFAILAALIAYTVFHFDNEILAFLSREGLRWRVLAAACIFVFVPIFAYVYSTVTSLFLKMIRVD